MWGTRAEEEKESALKCSSRCLHVESQFYADKEMMWWRTESISEKRYSIHSTSSLLLFCYLSPAFLLCFSLLVVIYRIRAPRDRAGSGPFSSVLREYSALSNEYFPIWIKHGCLYLLNLTIMDNNICNIPHCILLSWSALWNRHINAGSVFRIHNR